MSNPPWLRVRSGLLRAASSGRSLQLLAADTHIGARRDAAKPAARAMRVPDAAAAPAA